MPAPKPATALPRLDRILGYQLARATIPTTAIYMRAVGEPLGLRPVEYTILALLHEDPSLTPARLARALAVSAPNITAWLSRLEERGLLGRSTSATDRRMQVLGLTAAGERAAREGTRRLVEAEQQALSVLSPGEYALLNELLRKVAAIAGFDGTAKGR